MDFLQKDENPYQKEHLHKQKPYQQNNKKGKGKRKSPQICGPSRIENHIKKDYKQSENHINMNNNANLMSICEIVQNRIQFYSVNFGAFYCYFLQKQNTYHIPQTEIPFNFARNF